MKKFNEKISYIVASDVNPRDGIGVEIYLNNECELSLEIFRDDSLRRTYLKVYKENIDIETVEESIKIFRDENLGNYIVR